MDFCRIHDLRIMSARFEKSDWNKIKYRPHRRKHGEDPSTHRYEQIDLILVNDKYKNVVMGVVSNGRENLETDHYPVIMKVWAKFRKKKGRKLNAAICYTPKKYNINKEDMNKFFKEHLTTDEEINYSAWARVYGEYLATVEQIKIKVKKAYISRSTLTLIADRQNRYFEMTEEERNNID